MHFLSLKNQKHRNESKALIKNKYIPISKNEKFKKHKMTLTKQIYPILPFKP